MCGIVGLSYKNGAVTPELLEKATSVLTHRGPDGSNYWLNTNKTVGLGHTRLSIIDLEGGTQPLHNEDHTIHAVVNGELYDFERIRNELKKKGHRFTTASDSELLIHLYEEQGVEAVHSMRGEFAFILWDEKQRRLFAGRDRFGIKPLFYTIHNGNICLASEIKALLATGVPALWDEESLYISICLAGVPLQDRTFFKEIRQIPPGCTLTAQGGELQIQKYWDFNYPTLENQARKNIPEAEAIEQFRELFEEAVRLRLRADVPVGVYLSGGIDSCSILGTVAKIRGNGTKAFTISFADAIYDEFSIAKEMAELTKTDFSAYSITPELMASNFIDAVYHSETLMANPHSVAKFILSQHVRESGYKVVLTGEGSDEILGGYPHFRQDMLLHDPEHQNSFNIDSTLGALKKDNLASSGLLIAQKSLPENNSVKERLGYVPSWLLPLMDGAKKGQFLFNRKVRSRYAHVDPYKMFLDGIEVEKELQGRHALHQSQYLWSKLLLPNYLLSNLGDRMEMGHSIEGRVPFLDHKLVEFVTTLPATFKIRNLQEKYLLREALRPVLSKTVYERKKHPFVAPPVAGNKKDPMYRFMNTYIGDNAHKLPYFDQLKVKGVLKMLPVLPEKNRRMLDPILVVISSMIAIQDQFGMGLN